MGRKRRAWRVRRRVKSIVMLRRACFDSRRILYPAFSGSITSGEVPKTAKHQVISRHSTTRGLLSTPARPRREIASRLEVGSEASTHRVLGDHTWIGEELQ